MPTKEEFEELLRYCPFPKYEQLDGRWGQRFTNRQNGRSIFLPATGFIGPQLLKREDIFTERTSTIPSQGETNGHQWVDLGLPSGTKWATCNIDASSSEELGETFAWAEVTPASDRTSPKNDVYDKELMEIGYFFFCQTIG